MGSCEISDQNWTSLIDFQKIQGGAISGLEGHEIEKLLRRETDIEVMPDITDHINIDEAVFAELEREMYYKDLDGEIKSQMDQAELDGIPQSTKFSTKHHVDKFKNFLSKNNLPNDIESMPVKYLAQYLRFYYFSLKTKDGELYSPNSLIGIRASIQRYLRGPNVNRMINIITDKEFDRSNATLKAMIGMWLKSGQKTKQKFKAIQPHDMMILEQYFDASTPVKLQQEIWFYFTYYFGLRGRETLPQLKKNSIEFAMDSDGREYAFLNHSVISKNVKASINIKEFSDEKEYKMYDRKGESKTCPVERTKLYLSKIPSTNSSLFPMPNKNWQRSNVWYCEKRGLGRFPLGNMMKGISQEARLSQSYTNHNVRVTVVSELKDQGFSNEAICSITGHKNPASIAHYSRQRTDAAKRKICEALQDGFSNKISIHQTIKNDQQAITLTERGEAEITVQFSGSFHGCQFNIKKE